MIAQTIWGWPIVWYLFLAGTGAGAYAVGVMSELFRLKSALASKIGVALGAPLVLVGTVFLFLDLGQPLNFVYIFNNSSSMIAIGSAIILAFMIIGAVHFGFWIWPFKLLEKAEDARGMLGLLGIVFAFGTALYTGVLLGVLAAVPFWNNSLLPVLFLISALSTGLSLVVFGSAIFHKRLFGAAEEQWKIGESIKPLARADGILLGIELLVIMMYLSIVPGPLPTVAVSVQLILAGYLAPFFWIGLVLAGLAAPLVLDMMAHRGEAAKPSGSVTLYMLAGVLVLTGGLILRYLVLAAGVPVTYQPAYGTQPFFTMGPFAGSSGYELTSLVPGTSTYLLITTFFAALLLFYLGGSRLFISQRAGDPSPGRTGGRGGGGK